MNFSVRNQKGMSIITALVGASIGIIVMTGITTMIVDVFKAQKTAQSRDYNREVSEDIRDLLGDTDNCTATFVGKSPIGNGFNNQDQIVDGGGNIRFQTGSTYNNLVKIIDFEVKDFVADNPMVDPKLGRADLYIKMEKVGSTIGAKEMETRFSIKTRLSAANQIVECSSSGSLDTYWLESPFDPNNIFYGLGNVGVGTNNPRTRLHTSGVLNIGGDTNTPRNVGNALELATDSAFGSVNDDHTGVRMFAYDMNGWTTAKLGIQISNNWRTYLGGDNPTKADVAMAIGLDETVVRGRLGLGTGASPPLAKLHVAEATGRQISAGNSNTAWADMSSSGDGKAVFGANATLNFTDNSFRSSQTHGAGLGSRGLAINWPAWGDQTFFTKNGNTIANSVIAPTSLMTLKSNGRLGIGTTNPASIFEVVFDNQAAGVTNDFVVSRYDNVNDVSAVTFRRARGTQAAPANLQNGDTIGGINDLIRINGAYANSTAIRNVYRGNGSNNLSSMHFNTSNVQRVTITETGNVHFANHVIAGNLAQGLNSLGTALNGSIVSALGSGFSVAMGENAISERGIGIFQGNLERGAFFQRNLPVYGSTVIMKNHWGGHLAFQVTNAANNVVYFPMVISGSNRFVGIGPDDAPHVPAYQLDVKGDISTTSCFRIGSSSVSGICTSDERLKENIKDYKQGLNEILGLRLRTYQFNGLGEMPKTGETAVGVIAQEVEKTVPSLVKHKQVKLHPEDDKKTDIKVVDYSKFTYMLINAVKELYKKWFDDSEIIHQEIAALKNDIAAKDEKIKQLEKQNSAVIHFLCKTNPQAEFCN